MKASFQLGRVRGVPVEVSYTWLGVLLVVAAVLATQVLPALRPSWSTTAYWVVGLFTSFGFLASLLAHEVAHVVAASGEGVAVRRATLFGLAGATELEDEPASPRAEAAVATSGPLASIVLGGLFAALWLLGDDAWEHAGAVGLYLFSANCALAALDLLPSVPLDGGRILRSIVWQRTGDYDRATRVATRTGRDLGIALLLGGAAVGALVYWFSGVCVAFLGLFLVVASWASQRQAQLRRRLQGLTARDLMVVPWAVPGSTTLEEAIGSAAPGEERLCLLVGAPNDALGVLCPDRLGAVPRRRWSTTLVAGVMTPMKKIGAVASEDSGLTVLEKVQRARGGVVVVLSSAGEVIGVIRRDEVLEVYRTGATPGA